MDLSLSTRNITGLNGDQIIVVLEVRGRVDVYTAPQLRRQIVELVNDGSAHLVVDMEGVDHLAP